MSLEPWVGGGEAEVLTLRILITAWLEIIFTPKRYQF